MKIKVSLTVDYRESLETVKADGKTTQVYSEPSLELNWFNNIIPCNATPRIGETVVIPNEDGFGFKVNEVDHVLEDWVLVPEVHCSMLRLLSDRENVTSALSRHGFKSGGTYKLAN